jgi:hypothetical protein
MVKSVMSGKRKGYFCLDAQSENDKTTPDFDGLINSGNCIIPVLLAAKGI